LDENLYIQKSSTPRNVLWRTYKKSPLRFAYLS
jgi:hypothetical protein